MQDNFYDTHLFLSIILNIKNLNKDNKEITISTLLGQMDTTDLSKRERKNLRSRISRKLKKMVDIGQLTQERKFTETYFYDAFIPTATFNQLTT